MGKDVPGDAKVKGLAHQLATAHTTMAMGSEISFGYCDPPLFLDLNEFGIYA